MRNWMLGAAMAAGCLGVGTGVARAAEFGFHERGPVAYVPACPGPGYVWIAGYMADGYWVAGRWEFRRPVEARPFRAFDGPRERGRERGFDRERGEGARRW